MASKGGKSGRENRPRKIGVRGGNRGVGKKRLAEVVEVKGKLIGEGRALVGDSESGFEVLEGLERDGDFITNGVVRIRCGKKGLAESGWKVWENEEMVDTFEGKGGRGEEDVVMEEEVEVKEEKEEEWIRRNVDEVIGEMLEGVKGEGWTARKEKEKNVKEVEEVEVVDLCGSSEVDCRVGLLEEWKEEKEAKEKRERSERRKREVEGMVKRGKDRGMKREDVMEMKQAFGDYEEVVGDVGYVLGIEVGLARCFVMDREIRKAVEMVFVTGPPGPHKTRAPGEIPRTGPLTGLGRGVFFPFSPPSPRPRPHPSHAPDRPP